MSSELLDLMQVKAGLNFIQLLTKLPSVNQGYPVVCTVWISYNASHDATVLDKNTWDNSGIPCPPIQCSNLGYLFSWDNYDLGDRGLWKIKESTSILPQWCTSDPSFLLSIVYYSIQKCFDFVGKVWELWLKIGSEVIEGCIAFLIWE